MATTMYRREDLIPAARIMIDDAWIDYREAAVKIPDLPWDLYLEADSRLWSKYLEVERQALALRAGR